MKRSLLAFMAMVAVSSGCFAEVFFGINYAATLGEVKKIFPQAQYAKQTPAWLTEDQTFIKVEGNGMGGEIRIAFDDLRPTARRLLSKADTNGASKADIEIYKSIIAKSDDDALTVDWVRIFYNTPIPVSSFNKRYGKPAKCAHDQTFLMLCDWPDKALQAALSSDEKFVKSAESPFTKAEKHIWFNQSGKPIPPWLN